MGTRVPECGNAGAWRADRESSTPSSLAAMPSGKTAELAGQKSIDALRAEITGLREEVQLLTRQLNRPR